MVQVRTRAREEKRKKGSMSISLTDTNRESRSTVLKRTAVCLSQALQSDVDLCSYAQAKAATHSFAKMLASKPTAYGIGVHVVVPGMTRTPLVEVLMERRVGAGVQHRHEEDGADRTLANEECRWLG